MLHPTSAPPPPAANGGAPTFPDSGGTTRPRRRHGWQLPLHPLQFTSAAIFAALAASFYIFLAPLLGSRVAVNTLLSLFSFTAGSAAVMYVRCAGTDPSDRTHAKKLLHRGRRGGRLPKMNYGLILRQILLRLVRRIESRIFSCCIRRNYLEPWNSSVHMEPLLSFPLVDVHAAVSPMRKDDDVSYCVTCDFEVKLRSKHCKSCNRCVDGFDHHCSWLNNCVGRKNYTTFILLMVFVLLMLLIEGGTAIAVFVRCFASSSAIKREMRERLHFAIPRGVLAAIAMVLVLFTGYSAAALAQLFFFHVVLIRKGMRTYDYILAMREAQSSFNPFDDSDSSSDESFELDPPEPPSFLSRLSCARDGLREDRRLSIRIDKVPSAAIAAAPAASSKKNDVAINPWTLINMSKDKAMAAAERARERIREKLQPTSPMKPLPVETKQGPLMESNAVVTKVGRLQSSPGPQFSSPRRRTSAAAAAYKANFDLKLTEVSTELETHISRQLLCSVLTHGGGVESSPTS